MKPVAKTRGQAGAIRLSWAGDVLEELWEVERWELNTDEEISAQARHRIEAVVELLRELASSDETHVLATVMASGLARSRGLRTLCGERYTITTEALAPILTNWKKIQDNIALYPELAGDVPAHKQACLNVWALLSVYNRLVLQAEEITGEAGAAAYPGSSFTEDSEKAAADSRENRAFVHWELADLIGLGIVHYLLRLPAEAVTQAVESETNTVALEMALLATVFGEGALLHGLYKAVKQRRDFEMYRGLQLQVQQVYSALEEGFRRPKPLDQFIDEAFGASQQPALEGWRSPGHMGKSRDALITPGDEVLGKAEAYLRKLVADAKLDFSLYPQRMASQLSAAVRTFMKACKAATYIWEVSDEIDRFRDVIHRGIGSIFASDALNKVWDGPNTCIVNERKLHYEGTSLLIATYANSCRLLAAAEILLAHHSDVDFFPDKKETAWDRIISASAYSGVPILIEHYLIQYGPRLYQFFKGEAAFKGGANASEELDPLKHSPTVQVDCRIHALVTQAHTLGASLAAWGFVEAGVTAKLRFLCRSLGVRHPLISKVEAHLNLRELDQATRLVQETRLDLKGGEQGTTDSPVPRVTVAVHVCNAEIEIVNETMSRVVLVDWPADSLCLFLSSSSTEASIAYSERRICLRCGATHFFIAARRHLKAGNLNRAIPNVPSRGDETYYLILDDDHRPFRAILQRTTPLMEANPDAAFVQLPQHYYGNIFPGYGFTRRLDASHQYYFMSSVSPIFFIRHTFDEDESGVTRTRSLIPQLYGTGTTLRVSNDNSLREPDYFPTNSTTEDFALGYRLHEKRVESKSFASNKKDDGILLDEVWTIGDGVDAGGKQGQWLRWSEGSTKAAITSEVPSVINLFKMLLKRENTKAVLTQLAIIFCISFHYPIEAFTSVYLFIASPVYFLMSHRVIYSYEAITWVCCLAVILYCNGRVLRHIGLTFLEWLALISYERCLGFISVIRGVFMGFFKVGNKWASSKQGSGVPLSTKILMFAEVVLFHVLVFRDVGLDSFVYSDLVFLIPEIMFGYSLFLAFLPGTDHTFKGRIEAIARGVKVKGRKQETSEPEDYLALFRWAVFAVFVLLTTQLSHSATKGATAAELAYSISVDIIIFIPALIGIWANITCLNSYAGRAGCGKKI